MIQLEVLSGKSAGTSVVAGRLPFVVGREPGVDLRLDEPGVWGRHLELDLDPSGTFIVRPKPDAIAWVNGEPAPGVRLRSGDIIELGPAKLRFSLSPTCQVSFRVREVLTWAGLGMLCVLQLLAIYLLMP